MSQASLFAAPPPQTADDDVDLRDAIATFSPVVVRIRQLSASHFELSKTKVRERAAIEEEVQGLVADIASRAERLGTSLDEMFRLINASLAATRKDTAAPTGDYARHLADENCRAYAQERQIERQIGDLQRNLETATASRIAADRACAGFVAGYAIRGERKGSEK